MVQRIEFAQVLLLSITLGFYWTSATLRRRGWILSIASIVGISLFSIPIAVFVVVVSWAICRIRSLALWFVVVATGLVITKLGGFWTGIGVGFLGLRILQLTLDLRRGAVTSIPFRSALLYLSFFPTFFAGPLVSIAGLDQNLERRFSFPPFWMGIRRILIGLFKKEFLLDFVFRSVFGSDANLYENISTEVGPSGSWFTAIYLVKNMLAAYLDLSAYADLAIGGALLFGIILPENVNYPLSATSLADFWRRWHVTVTSFCQRNVFLPLAARFRSLVVAFLGSMLVMGIWHRPSWNWVGWALYHAMGLKISSSWQHYRRKLGLRPLPVLVARGVTLGFVAIGFSFIQTASPREAVALVTRLVGLA